jgi:hypothetical protein
MCVLGSVPVRIASGASPPPYTKSWYISSHWYNTYCGRCVGNGQSVWYNTGYYAINGGSFILDFGYPWENNGVWGIWSWEFGYASLATIKSELQSVISGYEANSSHTQLLDLLVGTNDSVYNSSFNYDAFGTQLAKMLDSLGSTPLVIVDGANDVEPQWTQQYGVPPSESLEVADGWNYQEYGGNGSWLYDFGWLDESSYNSGTHTPSYPYGWTPTELNKLNWAGEEEANFLEEYDSTWPYQLQHLDLYSYYNTLVGAWFVDNVLAGQTFLDPDTAWNDTLYALNHSGCSCTSTNYIDYLSEQMTLS